MTDGLMLALSTSSGVAQVCATTSDGQVMFQYQIDDYKAQSAELLPRLHQSMADGGVQAEQFIGVAVDVGPGGFTSLRTACGVAQGLAVGWQLPCYPISSFRCLQVRAALDGQRLDGSGTVLIDARLNEFYAESNPGKPVLLPAQPDFAVPVLESKQWVLVAPSAWGIIQHWGLSIPVIESVVCSRALSAQAWVDHAAGRAESPMACQPLYVREKVAQTTEERRATHHAKS